MIPPVPVNKKDAIQTGLKIGLPIVGVALGAIVLRRIFKKKNADGTKANTAPSLNDMKVNKDNLTISPSDASLYANTLYSAMQSFGTDEKTIYNTINKLQTKDDMLLVIKAFGLKKYLWLGRAQFLGQDFNLITWLRTELKPSEIAKIKPKFDGWGIPL